MKDTTFYLLAYLTVGHYELPAMKVEISIAPPNLIPEINSFLNKMSEKMQLIMQTCMPRETSVPVSIRIEVGRGGEMISRRYENVNVTKNLDVQLWEVLLDIAPELAHAVVCTSDFRNQSEAGGT